MAESYDEKSSSGNQPGESIEWPPEKKEHTKVVRDYKVTGKDLLSLARQILLSGLALYILSIVISLVLLDLVEIPKTENDQSLLLQSKIRLIEDIWNYSKVAVIGIITSVIGFYFGSSSANKN